MPHRVRYVNNVAKYIELIEPGCKRMIWLHTTAICGGKNHCQRNTRILLWNQLVEAMLQARRLGHRFWTISRAFPRLIPTHALRRMSNAWLSADWCMESDGMPDSSH